MKTSLEQELYDLTEKLAYDEDLSNEERDDLEREITELEDEIENNA